MGSSRPTGKVLPGDLLLVVHDFHARSSDELNLTKGDLVELIERDDEFGDGWFLGRQLESGSTGLFPEVYTTKSHHEAVVSDVLDENTSTAAEDGVESETGSLTYSASLVEPPAPLVELKPTQNASIDNPLHDTAAFPYSGSSAPTSPMVGSASSNTTQTISRSSVSSLASIKRDVDISGPQNSPVMNETLSVINEHITDMHAPHHGTLDMDNKVTNDSGSEYSSRFDNSATNINVHDTEEEERAITEDEVLTWNPLRVAEYLEDLGVEMQHCDIFRDQEISGDVLLGMDQQTILLKDFELGSLGRRLKTWQKIKAFQQELKTRKDLAQKASVAVTESSSKDRIPDPTRNRNSSLGTLLPRIPSFKGEGNRNLVNPTPHRTSSLHKSYPKLENNSPLSKVMPSQSRYSSDSTQGLSRSRRPDSADVSIRHQNQLSSEKKSQNSIFIGRPSSVDNDCCVSSESVDCERLAKDSCIARTSMELDRGYFSGGEVDRRKSRNIFHKNHCHSRNSSYDVSDRRKSGNHKSPVHLDEVDPIRDDVAPIVSPAAKVYFNQNKKRATHRTSCGTVIKTLTDQDPPIVTKLNYNSSSIDAIASASTVPEANPSSSTSSQRSGTSDDKMSSKPRTSAVTVLSDFGIGNELPLGNNISEPSSVRDLLQSSVKTGSSVASGALKNIDKENCESLNTGVGSSSARSTSSAKRKSKKATSAYVRGLEAKSPQEQINSCDFSGWMKKKSSTLMSTWKSRLFVLRGRRLSYYYSESDTEEKGLIDISSHRVLPADNERITGFHAVITGAASTPSVPHSHSLIIASPNPTKVMERRNEANSGIFLFKLVPPRSGLSNAVNFTKPMVHYFAVDNVTQGRLWMAALMKATIERGDLKLVFSTYQQKTVSLAKARAMKQMPRALLGDDQNSNDSEESKSFDISGLSGTPNSLRDCPANNEEAERVVARQR